MADKEEQLMERELILQQVCRLTDRLNTHVSASKDDTLNIAKKVLLLAQSRFKLFIEKLVSDAVKKSIRFAN